MVSLKESKGSNQIKIPKGVILYNQSREKIGFGRLKEFVRGNFALRLEVRQNFPTKPSPAENLALRFAQARIRNINDPLARYRPLQLEIENEINYLKSGRVNKNLIYDGINLVKLFESLVAKEESDTCQIVLTNRLLGTFADDRRFHLRTIICGYPVLISMPGMVEAPARPKEFYRIKNKLITLGVWEQQEDQVKAKFRGRFIDYKDRRIVEVLKGLISQALFFYIIGEPFCKIKACRLFNSHWQEDLIYSQVKKGEFCPKHQATLRKLCAH